MDSNQMLNDQIVERMVQENADLPSETTSEHDDMNTSENLSSKNRSSVNSSSMLFNASTDQE